MVVLGWWLDKMILKVSSKLYDSVILYLSVQAVFCMIPRRSGAPTGFLMMAVLGKPSLWRVCSCCNFLKLCWVKVLFQSSWSAKSWEMQFQVWAFPCAWQQYSSARSPGVSRGEKWSIPPSVCPVVPLKLFHRWEGIQDIVLPPGICGGGALFLDWSWALNLMPTLTPCLCHPPSFQLCVLRDWKGTTTLRTQI